ncbi:hypothetical protein ACTJKC_14790 [Pedobacter sp. 22226]|uniref:hypothetical protein n=1 Tax=Pedobacter sp. 22226 TaxID=3453894 RepID=UPI003F86C077
MSKINDAGHHKNVANFENLIAYLTGYGAVYNPSNVNIQLKSLNEKAVAARTITEQVHDLAAKNSSAIAARDLAFKPLKKLSTRIVNAIKASNVSQQVADNAATNNRKIQGQRTSAKLTDEEKEKLAASGTIVNQVSASQQSFDAQLDNFDKQIKLLGTIPTYAPNEVELQQATLTTLYNDLLQKNRDVVAKTSELSGLRLNRNNILYHPETGIVALALYAKNYSKSIFGASTPQYKQISGIPFKTVKI